MTIFDKMMLFPEFALFAKENDIKSTGEIIAEYGIEDDFAAAKNSQKFTKGETEPFQV